MNTLIINSENLQNAWNYLTDMRSEEHMYELAKILYKPYMFESSLEEYKEYVFNTCMKRKLTVDIVFLFILTGNTFYLVKVLHSIAEEKFKSTWSSK